MSFNCDCGGKSVPLTKNGTMFWPDWKFCPACEHKYAEFSDPKRGAEWALEPIGIPIQYQKTVIEKIPCAKMRDVASNWKNWGERSLLLHGTTRLGKTRAAWEVSRNYWKQNYKPQMFLTMRDFERIIEEGFNKFDHSKRLNELINARFLFIDDLGKERMTQRVACDLFAVIDGRTIHERPTIITTNFNSSSLLARFDDQELGAALIGRFRDYFDIVGATNENNS